MMGMESKEENFLFAVREGAAGYVLSEAPAAEVLNAIRRGRRRRSGQYPPTLFRGTRPLTPLSIF